MPERLPFAGWLGGSFSVRMGSTPAPEGVGEAEGEAEGDAVGMTVVGAGELPDWGCVALCAEICSSSLHAPSSFTRLHTMTKRGVPVLSTKETSTVAVAVVPRTSPTCKEWMVELCISYDCSPAIQLASSCWLLKVGPK